MVLSNIYLQNDDSLEYLSFWSLGNVVFYPIMVIEVIQNNIFLHMEQKII